MRIDPTEKVVSAKPVNCPLCRHSVAVVYASLACAEIVAAWRQMKVSLASAALDVFAGRTRVDLYECAACGFRFFDSSLAGNDVFYQELQNQIPGYYPTTRPACQRVIEFALRRRLQTAMDVGCGSGGFLDLAKKSGMRTFGIELNPQAARLSTDKGHKVYSCSMAEFCEGKTHERFDLVTAFEVLEHVADPVGFLSSAAGLLNPGGYLAVSVPNRSGVIRLCEENPHQWPPHHLSWWRRRDLARIGERCNLEIVQTGGDILMGGQIELFCNLRNDLRAGWGETPGALWRVVPPLVSFIYRKTGCRFFFPRLGPSIHAFYRKSA